jgi:hypothetical protein
VRWNIGGSCFLVAIAACARMGAPPGGPPDAVIPSLIATRPDSFGVYPGFEGAVEFVFDETISEGSQPNMGRGTGDLEKLIIVSPTDEVPRIRWDRDRILVAPREGWQPGRVYRVELLPGIVDLRRNRSRQGRVVTFSTGAPLPTDSIRGIAIDWTTRAPARVAEVVALLLPDSLPYRTTTDSSGRFSLGPIPHGQYRVTLFADQNRNRRQDGRELWDSLPMRPAPSDSNVFWLAPRDTAGVRMTQVTFRDSLTIELQLTQAPDPYQLFDATQVVVRMLPDSTPIGVASLRGKLVDDSLVARARAIADSIKADSVARARPDSAARPAPARPATPPATQRDQDRGRGRTPVDSTVIRLAQSRPALNDRLIVRLSGPLRPDTRYSVELSGVRNLLGVNGGGTAGFRTAVAPVRRDTTAAAPRTPADSTP